MLQLLVDNPLLLLFTVAAIGYPLGQIKVGGTSLGVAAVLFVGLAIGALDPNLKLPEIIYTLGLVLFVYTIGLSSGPGFFSSFRRKGLRDNLLVMVILILAAVMVVVAYNLLKLKPAMSVGLFTGSVTNTAALASVLEVIKGLPNQPNLNQLLTEPVVGYSIAYPMGVVGMIITIYFFQRFWKIDYAAEAQKAEEPGATSRKITNRTIEVTKESGTRQSVHNMVHENKWEVVFGRILRNGQFSLVENNSRLALGDLVTVVGPEEEIERVTAYLGEPSEAHLELDRTQLDFRRMFISNPKIAGFRLRDLNLPQQYGAIITRVRRGDIEFVPNGDTVLELGDRVRVLTYPDNMEALGRFLGDSYRALSEINILSFSLGLAAGLLIGVVPLPLPGGITIKLGLAGGPLIVALILGTLERTGPIVWNLPYSANLTLRQFGLILFLAGVGTRAGYPFVTTFTQGGGILIFLAGAVITFVVSFIMIFIGYRVLKIPMGKLIGMMAGMQTQPAVLGFALEQTKNELPNIGYATVYPIATISKIVLAQLLISLLL
ncbi:MAG TPA: aspartate:alanine exchanger family transporter [Chloroflexia bacterium]|nr:aspartate:alanine exchanger family transporter [Chloroflexia bacterium]